MCSHFSVPFFIRMPGSASQGQSTNALAEAIDVFPTLLDLATGSPVPDYLDGVSLRPVVENASATAKATALSEFVGAPYNPLLSLPFPTLRAVNHASMSVASAKFRLRMP